MRVILDFIYGVLNTIPDEQLPSLLLAAKLLQVITPGPSFALALLGKVLGRPCNDDYGYALDIQSSTCDLHGWDMVGLLMRLKHFLHRWMS